MRRMPILLGLLAFGRLAPPAPVLAQPVNDPGELLARIRALPGVVAATAAPSTIGGTLFFRISFEQPVDHDDPGGPTFRQRITLLHRSEATPTVLGLDGYYLSARFPSQRELTVYLQANQLNVEHRFFPPSTPDPRPWPRLTIAQAAADHHRIVQSFKSLYTGKWVSTGVSKGGMAAVYHRFFYPLDVDATVPYVAPSSHGPRDARYVRFVDRIGAPGCRDTLQAFQQAVLARRDEILPLVPPLAFDIFGAERALEFAVVETPFAFWQYYRFTSCDAIPSPDASAAELFTFLDGVSSVSFFADDDLNAFAPYYYQSATELGGPRFDERSLRGQLNFPREDVPATYPPLGVEKHFDASAMPEVEQWVKTAGPRMLFIYGANDPWSATAFDVKAANDSYRFFVSGGDHLAAIHELPAAKRIFVLTKLKKWLGISGLDAVRLGADDTPPRYDPPTRRELFLR
jgi:PS-10 peptidase S37